MIHVLIAVFLLGALAFFSFALGDEFGDDVRRGLNRADETVHRLAGTVRRSPALLVRSRGAHTGPMLALPDVPPAQVGTSSWRMPSRVENEAAAGGSPGAEGTWSSPQAPGEVPPRIDVAARFAEALARNPIAYDMAGTPPEGIDAVRDDGTITVGRRPVNGRSLGDMPRRQPLQDRAPWQPAEQPAHAAPTMFLTGPMPAVPVYGQAPQLEVEPELARRLIA